MIRLGSRRDRISKMEEKENGSALSEKEAKQVAKALEAEIKPHVLKASDIKFEKGEEDVRSIDRKNYRQIEYKFLTTQTALLHNMAQSLVDIQRLLMLVLRKQGVKDISKELLELYEELKDEADKASEHGA